MYWQVYFTHGSDHFDIIFESSSTPTEPLIRDYVKRNLKHLEAYSFGKPRLVRDVARQLHEGLEPVEQQ